jgi:hypothetical protein
LSINELIDLDIKEFERLNRSTLNFSYRIYNVMQVGANRAPQTPTKDKKHKRKASNAHLNVGLGKRVDPSDDSSRKIARKNWENLNIKKDHIKMFTDKSKLGRVL